MPISRSIFSAALGPFSMLISSRYEIINFDGGKEVRTGTELMRGHDIKLREKPAAAVLLLKSIK